MEKDNGNLLIDFLRYVKQRNRILQQKGNRMGFRTSFKVKKEKRENERRKHLISLKERQLPFKKRFNFGTSFLARSRKRLSIFSNRELTLLATINYRDYWNPSKLWHADILLGWFLMHKTKRPFALRRR